MSDTTPSSSLSESFTNKQSIMMGFGHQRMNSTELHTCSSTGGNTRPRTDQFVTIDVESLSPQAVRHKNSISSPRVQFERSPSRKEFRSHAVGRARKEDVAAAGAGAAGSKSLATSAGHTLHEKLPVSMHVESGQEFSMLPLVTTQTATEEGADRRRRRRPGRLQRWPDPRKVVLGFATLSSMGTLILLYFTLYMDKMASGDVNG